MILVNIKKMSIIRELTVHTSSHGPAGLSAASLVHSVKETSDCPRPSLGLTLHLTSVFFSFSPPNHHLQGILYWVTPATPLPTLQISLSLQLQHGSKFRRRLERELEKCDEKWEKFNKSQIGRFGRCRRDTIESWT